MSKVLKRIIIIIRQTVRRIAIEILEVKELNDRDSPCVYCVKSYWVIKSQF